MELIKEKPQSITDLETFYGPPSQAGFASAVFFVKCDARAGLTDQALEIYQYFTGELWERWGADAWMSVWKEVYSRAGSAKKDVVAELRAIKDVDVSFSVPMILDNLENAEQARDALSAVYDDPAIDELRVFNLGDGGAMSGLLVAAKNEAHDAAVFLAFLLD